ncbi:MAG: hypothetical protein CVT49_14925 [candidate division Zixibacteria bacterium HGW-Zixibacteria-1]|nr:MAG: hypothetical protein CVT49_14925 [candidate division Zixibacteria bacterium HGW-Zixibacteria-1]
MSRLSKLFLIVIGVFLPILAAGSNTSSEYWRAGSVDLIETAYSTGIITKGDRLFYNLQTVFQPEKLPEEYQSEFPGIIRSGTPFVNDALDHWDLMSATQQEAATAMLARPTTDSVYISPDGKFAVHYDIDDLNGVPPEDLDADQVPDFVERIGLYADSSYRYYHYDLGYYPPPSDGDSLYDIYILHVGNYYGTTVRESAGDSSWGDFSSYIKIHNNFSFALPNDDPEGTIIGAQKVTCAHEYFHATQMAYAYKSGADLWWTEGSAVFFENEVFDEVNDHYYYLPYFFNYPDTFLIDTNAFPSSLHNYSTFVWPEYLAKRYSLDIIRTIWEYARYNNPLTSMNLALNPYGKNMATAFLEFAVWNYFTGTRYDPDYHEDGADYPQIVVAPVAPQCPFSDLLPVIPPDGLASNYIMAYPDTSENGILVVNFDGDNTVSWGFSYILFEGENHQVTTACAVDYMGRTNCGIYDFLRYDSIVFIPCVVSQWHDDNSYVFSTEIHPFGDVDGSGEVNILDITQLIKYLYKSGLPPKYDLRVGDVNCSGNANVLDASYLIYFLYRGGPESCAYRP